jgi:hypothetical protein
VADEAFLSEEEVEDVPAADGKLTKVTITVFTINLIIRLSAIIAILVL